MTRIKEIGLVLCFAVGALMACATGNTVPPLPPPACDLCPTVVRADGGGQ
jgi:hypothetical protein